MSLIHPTALIDPAAKIAADVEIGPYSIIGPDVEIGSGCKIGPHVVIKGPSVIGARNRIFQFASVGEDCQDKKYKGEPTRLILGDDNVIREGVTIHRGTVQDQQLTQIGSRNLFMAYSHVAHDCIVGNDCILANQATLAGHVTLGDFVILGGLSAVHQFSRVGSHAMCGGGSIILKDIAAYTMISGHPAESHGINYEGLKRRGFSKEAMQALRSAYKTVFRQGLNLQDAIAELETSNPLPEVQVFIDSIKNSQRGITR
ncbi:acyl-[acyl-carrier-protein]--UDP-N-acetylglucosamine O-acyltransferase [Marinospirillum celere]|uniref:Acyl-[acyl-carrier-protein]--UDP-N-acetylglucosamine O-acyltransferase n=1 Tax=Marinospirillum celere TaxID=1122252 RepID=A0A1I1IQB3_9GAMM|nr:acyl-ACP--UDP-N-acetylglucosamine O-acyltransferase [Marinospirillum celere]SFC38415.1 acyl-[acyl-carrier-protein]--UDP-N-acetylglucosamine O-acyltransferase [Marinospirillum celere]